MSYTYTYMTLCFILEVDDGDLQRGAEVGIVRYL